MFIRLRYDEGYITPERGDARQRRHAAGIGAAAADATLVMMRGASAVAVITLSIFRATFSLCFRRHAADAAIAAFRCCAFFDAIRFSLILPYASHFRYAMFSTPYATAAMLMLRRLFSFSSCRYTLIF